MNHNISTMELIQVLFPFDQHMYHTPTLYKVYSAILLGVYCGGCSNKFIDFSSTHALNIRFRFPDFVTHLITIISSALLLFEYVRREIDYWVNLSLLCGLFMSRRDLMISDCKRMCLLVRKQNSLVDTYAQRLMDRQIWAVILRMMVNRTKVQNCRANLSWAIHTTYVFISSDSISLFIGHSLNSTTIYEYNSSSSTGYCSKLMRFSLCKKQLLSRLHQPPTHNSDWSGHDRGGNFILA